MLAQTNLTIFIMISDSFCDQTAEIPVIPSFARIYHNSSCGIRAIELPRNAIYFVTSGTKYIYRGEKCYAARAGDVIYMSSGHYYVSERTYHKRSYEEIIAFYSDHTLCDLVTEATAQLANDNKIKPYTTYSGNSPKVAASKDRAHSRQVDSEESFCIEVGTPIIAHFFALVKSYLQEGEMREKGFVERQKRLELIYICISRANSKVGAKLLGLVVNDEENFRQRVLRTGLTARTLEELAQGSCYSLSKFKKEFTRQFGDTPHHWLITQRLQRAKLLLRITNMPIKRIGIECYFKTSAHFVKVFRQRYGITPGAYRKSG